LTSRLVEVLNEIEPAPDAREELAAMLAPLVMK
jgi:hypothetical protein